MNYSLFLTNHIKFVRLSIAALLLSCIFIYIIPDAQGQQSLENTIAATITADSYVASGRPGLSEPNLKLMWIGYDQSGGFQIQRTLLKFDLSNVPQGSTVKSATVSLYLARTTSNAPAMDIKVSRITNDLDSNNWLNNPTEDMTWQRHLQLQTTDVNAVSTSVSPNLGRYEWQITDLVQAWLNSNPRTTYLGIMIKGDESIGQHERGFWTKDCNPQECGTDKSPLLTIQFETPTPTPTNSPTVTPTPTLIPTAIPTPTPGIETLKLKTDKPGEIAVDDLLLYDLTYKTNNFSTYTLTDVVITDTIPAYTQLVTNTIEASSGFTHTYNGYMPGSVITWTLLHPLSRNEIGQVSYQVKRTATITSTVTTTSVQTSSDEEKVIYNDGMDMSWIYDEKREHMRSNSTRNPPYYLYLPTVRR